MSYIWMYSCHQGKKRRGEILWDADVMGGVNNRVGERG